MSDHNEQDVVGVVNQLIWTEQQRGCTCTPQIELQQAPFGVLISITHCNCCRLQDVRMADSN